MTSAFFYFQLTLNMLYKVMLILYYFFLNTKEGGGGGRYQVRSPPTPPSPRKNYPQKAQSY